MGRPELNERDLTALLVSYAAETATDAERAEVEALVARDPAAATRLERVRASGAAQAQIDAEDQAEWSPGELGLRRLMREIESAPPAAPVQSDRIAWGESVTVWRGVAVAAMLALTVVGVWRFDGAETAPTGGYGLHYSNIDGDGLAQIAFNPDATEAQIRALLLETGAKIIDGPSALGIYRVGFESAEARDAAVARLGAAPAVDSISAE